MPADKRTSDNRPLWQLIVEALPAKDVETEWFSLAEIAPLLNLTPHALTKHARDLWPTHEEVLARLAKRGDARC